MHTIPAPEEREVEVGEVQVGEAQVGEAQVGEVEMGGVLGRPVEDIRRRWLLLKKEIGRWQYASEFRPASCLVYTMQSAADVEAVLNEVAFMKELKGHANIIRIKHAHVHVVMELCEWGDLFDCTDSH
ncbi:unnamed protein product [Closterium sp. Naga37s-1]|nr:unnamed protein product [Closterium sp. Naga37s-1]